MTNLCRSLTWLQVKKVFVLLMVVCLCVTTVGIHVEAAGTSGVDPDPVVTPLGAADDDDDEGEDAPLRVKLSQSDEVLDVGKNLVITAEISPSSAAAKKVNWSITSGIGVIRITPSGSTCTITALKSGEATVRAEVDGEYDDCEIIVDAVPTSIKMPSTLTVAKEKSSTLAATILPSDVEGYSISWSSSKYSVATVDDYGKVTGKAGGIATITAETDNGVKAYCTVTVAEVKLNATKTTLQVNKNTTALKVASKYPSSDSVKSWSSDKPKIASVNGKGKIVAKMTGTAKITVTMKSGATASCTVKVQSSKVTTKSLKMSSSKLKIAKGKKATLTVTRNPITATEKITWKSSNKKVAIVNANGKVTAKGTGKANITAKANGKTAKCAVTVTK